MRYETCADRKQELMKLPIGIRVYDNHGQAYETTGMFDSTLIVLDEKHEYKRAPKSGILIYEDISSNVCSIGVI